MSTSIRYGTNAVSVNGEAVAGYPGPLPAGTAATVGDLKVVTDGVPPGTDGVDDGTSVVNGTKDTVNPLLAPRASDYVSPGISNVGGIGAIGTAPTYPFVAGTAVGGASDTTGANGGATTTPTSTAMSGSVDTLQPGQIGVGANPVYRDSSAPVPGTVKDTTRTDIEQAGSLTNPLTTGYPMLGTTETYDIGSAGTGTGASVPVAPTAVTAVAGPRQVTVSWTHPADPALDPVLGFVIQNSAGGTTYAGAQATSVVVTNLVPAPNPVLDLNGNVVAGLPTGYTFQVRARNKAGNGPLSTASASVRPYNPDENDAIEPAGLVAANVLNPIYSPDGTVKAGTGRNNAPALGAYTAQAGKKVTIVWTAPTAGVAPTSYVVTASDGTAPVTLAAPATTVQVTLTVAAAGASVSVTVQAINVAGAGAVSAPSGTVVVLA